MRMISLIGITCMILDCKLYSTTLVFFFYTEKSFTDMTEKLCGYIGGVCVPFPLPPNADDVCNLVTCPLKAGQTYNISVTINVDSPGIYVS